MTPAAGFSSRQAHQALGGGAGDEFLLQVHFSRYFECRKHEKQAQRRTRPWAVAPEMNSFSRSGLEGMVNGTFISDRTSSATGLA